MKQWVRTFLLCLSMAISLTAMADPVRAIYSQTSSGNVETTMMYELLKMALEKSGRDFVLEPSKHGALPEAREQKFIESGSGEVTIGYYGTSRALERRLLPVRIPLTRGVLGHRVFWIHKDTQAEFDKITTLEQLAQKTALQEVGWSDVEILRSAGLEVSVSRYGNLFEILNRKRADYFPRGVNEIGGERHRLADQYKNIALEKNLVLIYPFTDFFFVNRADQSLHDAIYDGLVAAYDDGHFLEIFRKHQVTNGMALIEGRRRLYVPNPHMSAETLKIPARYWEKAMVPLLSTSKYSFEPEFPVGK